MHLPIVRQSTPKSDQFVIHLNSSEQRKAYNVPLSGKTKSSTPQNKDVLINIEVMKYNSDSFEYTPIRRKSLPLKTNKLKQIRLYF